MHGAVDYSSASENAPLSRHQVCSSSPTYQHRDRVSVTFSACPVREPSSQDLSLGQAILRHHSLDHLQG
jgi:hypothetical protein